ncbi:MAG: hypothetical protein ACI4OM_04415, partial [Evtepia sp.]
AAGENHRFLHLGLVWHSGVKASQSFAAAAAKESNIIFSGGMYGGKYTSHGGNVRTLWSVR